MNPCRMKKNILLSGILSVLAVSYSAAAAEDPNATDPLLRYQWHLKNTGQPVIADSRPIAGVDLNIEAVHRANILGKGVFIAIIDDGLEIKHEDLAANVRQGASRNFYDNSTDPTPHNTLDEHGTSVAGIIAAVGWNNKGGRGVAPEAQIAGYNFLSRDGDTYKYDQDIHTIYGWGDGDGARDAQIFNNSWGTANQAYPAISQAQIASWDKLTNGTRNGKGGIYVKSAGNNFEDFIVKTASGDIDLCLASTKNARVPCASANSDDVDNFINVITVAAVNAKGVRSSYSSSGSSVWISGIGGEYGYQSKYITQPMKTAYDPAIVTTDLSGCAAGHNEDRGDGLIYNELDTSNSRVDASCNYWARMNGTSAASPTVSGVAALILQVNPDLTSRDVKYILATTARKIDPDYPPATYKGNIIDPAWTTNKAGHAFSNWYGFGLIDANAAVAKAKNFTSLPARKDTGWISSKDSDQPIGTFGSPAVFKVNVASDAKVENVQLSFSTTHKTPKYVLATLTSPEGTESTILTPLAALTDITTGSGFTVPLTSSNAFLDEPAGGVWTLKVTDINGNSSALLRDFNIRVVGH